MKNWFNQFNRGRRWLKDEIRGGPPKILDAVRELIVQNRHVAYHEMELFLGISPTSI